MLPDNARRAGPVTPLTVILGFLTITEVTVVYGLTKTSGAVQGWLVGFVYLLPVLVGGAFFLVLWKKPYILYPPTAFSKDVPATHFGAPAPIIMEHVALAEAVKSDPSDESAQFEVLDSLLGAEQVQALILMDEKGLEIPLDGSSVYVYEMVAGGGCGSGGMWSFKDRLCKTPLVRQAEDGRRIAITEMGRRFVAWAIKKGRKATYFSITKVGSWGIPSFELKKSHVYNHLTDGAQQDIESEQNPA